MRMEALVGDKLEQINQSLEQKREATYQGLDGASKNPSGDCQGLEKYLNDEANPQKRYPADVTCYDLGFYKLSRCLHPRARVRQDDRKAFVWFANFVWFDNKEKDSIFLNGTAFLMDK